jgi:hypothetical protein
MGEATRNSTTAWQVQDGVKQQQWNWRSDGGVGWGVKQQQWNWRSDGGVGWGEAAAVELKE